MSESLAALIVIALAVVAIVSIVADILSDVELPKRVRHDIWHYEVTKRDPAEAVRERLDEMQE